MARMNLSLDDTLIDEVRRLIPSRQRSRFISDAVRKELDQLKQHRAVREAAGLWSSEGRIDPTGEVQAQRDEWKDRGTRVEEGDG